MFVLFPFNCVSAQVRRCQRVGRAIRDRLMVVCWAFWLLLSTGTWFHPLGRFCFPLTDCWQGVKKPSRIDRVPLPISRFCGVSISRMFGRPQSWLVTGCFTWQVGYPGLLTRQRVSIFLWQGRFWTVCWGGVGGLSQWTDLGLGDGEEVLLWLEQSPAQ